MIKNPAKIKVGDKVKWYGRQFEPKDGTTQKMVRAEYEKREKKFGDNFDVDKFRESVFKPLRYRRGIATIVNVDTKLLGNKTLVDLSNGILFVLEGKNIRIKKY